MTKHEEAKKKIKDWLRDNPGATVTQAFKACKVKPTNFYYRPRTTNAATPAPAASKVAYQKVDGAKPAPAAAPASPAAFPPHDGKLFMIVGTAQQIREMLK